MPIPRSMRDHSAVHIVISLHHGRDAYRPSDRLYGEAILIAQVDTYFEIIEIHLTGISRTHNDYITSGGVINYTAGAHNFLSISQPNLERHWPHDNVLKAKHQYILPFEFTLPSTLLSSACDHRVASASIREAHLQLPPSLNDNDDDSAMLKAVRKLLPKTVEIRYDILVHVRMAKKSVAVSKPRKIVEMRRKIQVKPSYPRAHLSLQEIHGTAHNYMNLRHELLRRKCGSVAMNMAPLEALHISNNSLRHHLAYRVRRHYISSPSNWRYHHLS